MHPLKWLLVCGVCLGANPVAWAQFKNDAEAVKYRQGVFTAMKVHFGRLSAVAQGKLTFDAEATKRDAQIVHLLSSMPWLGFGESTATLSDKAKPEIWVDRDKFKQGTVNLEEKTQMLAQAAQSADLEKIKLAVGAVGKSCKSCHDTFRN